MAAYLSLTEKTTGKVYQGANLVELDEEICKDLGVEPDPVLYYLGWMDSIGFRLAMGQAWDEIKKVYAQVPERLAIVDYLEGRFENSSYHGR